MSKDEQNTVKGKGNYNKTEPRNCILFFIHAQIIKNIVIVHSI